MKLAAHLNDDWWGRKCVPCCSTECAANEHFRSVNFVTHTHTLPSPPATTSVISVIPPIGLCSFLTSLVLSCIGNRGMHVRKPRIQAYSFSLSLFSLCARVYRSSGFVWKKGRDTFLITSREPRLGTSIFGHWHATIFSFFLSFHVLLLLFFFLVSF